MSTAATQQQPPVIPPRPNRSQERDQSGFPKVPPRPTKRAVSPNPDRYAPSPLNGGIPPKKDRSNSNGDPIDRSKSVEIPHMVGEEGMEYAALAEQVAPSREASTSPTQTRTVGEDLKMYAPKATMPAQSAKQRIMQVTRTDSDKAASFGIGKPSNEVTSPSTRSLKKKASTASGLSHSEAEDEERGIPEIGQHVPLLAHAGDVQAPSPAPGALAAPEPKNHKRKTSSRGLPPGSYGLHGHNVAPQDKLEKEYYQKHPELLKLEHHIYQHDRATDFSMSREQLNKMVRDSELHGHGVGKYKSGTSPSTLGESLTRSQGTADLDGLPNEQAVYAAYSEAASRPHSVKPPEGSPQKREFESGAGGDVIVVEEPSRRKSVLFSDGATSPLEEKGESDYRAPILAEDEVRKNTPRPDQAPAVELSRERRGSDYDMEPPRSRPTSRPASLYKVDSSDMRSTPLEDVIEYEPLFPEDEEGGPEKTRLTAAQIQDMKHRFPSRDIWEDAPNSVHHTAEVNTPDVEEEEFKKVPSREQNETPAQAFARKQEELAEKELTHPDAFLWRNQKPAWVAQQPHLAQEVSRKNTPQRFPSRDVWEDTPDSLKLETTVSRPQMEQASPVDNKPELATPQRKTTDPKDKPVIPERPKPKSSEEAAGAKPVIPDRPKPQVPARPAKTSSVSSTASADTSAPAPKAKPAVPARPAGNKIAALQAGFMADLNKKLGLGPQAPKLEEEAKEEKVEAPKEKVPLSDARKGRARGPQRRAPAPAAAPVTKPAAESKPKLSFTTTVTVWSIDPEADGGALVGEVDPVVEEVRPVEPVVEAVKDEKPNEEEPVNVEKKSEAESEIEYEAQQESKTVDEVPEPKEEARDDPSVEAKTVPLTTSKSSGDYGEHISC